LPLPAKAGFFAPGRVVVRAVSVKPARTLSWGAQKLHFICLWSRKAGDGLGGTKHMYDTVVQHAGQVHVLDTTKLW
jgi:hypothetical protein